MIPKSSAHFQQVAATCLGVPLDRVYIAGTSTDKIPNGFQTAGSMSTDLYGAAVQDACGQLAANLAPFRKAMPGASFRVRGLCGASKCYTRFRTAASKPC